MNAWRRWREIRGRFLVLGALTLLAAGMVAANTPDHVAQQLAVRDAASQVELRMHRIDGEWFGNKGPSMLIVLGAIFFAAGGLATEPGRGATLFTAALPVSRRRLLGAQLGVAAAATAALALIGILASVIGGLFVGARYPVSAALAGGFVQFASAIPLAAMLLALQSISRHAIGATATLLGGALIGPAILTEFTPRGGFRDAIARYEFPPMIHWEPAPGIHTLDVPALVQALPWGSLSVAAVATGVCSAIAIGVFERREL